MSGSLVIVILLMVTIILNLFVLAGMLSILSALEGDDAL